MEVHSETFTIVSRGASPRKSLSMPTSPVADHSNRFNALMEDHSLEVLQGETFISLPHGTHS